MPKSSAPSESRLAGMCSRSRQVAAKSSENGIVSTTMIAPRTLPRKANRMMATRIMPSVRLCSTVCVVKCSRSLRSMNASSVTPLGRICAFSCFTFSFTPSSVGCALAPFCRPQMPETTSSLSTSLPSFIVICFAELAQADHRALFDNADVPDANRSAIFGCDHGVRDVLNVAHQAHFAHVHLLQALLDKAAAAVGVVVGELLLHLGDAQPIIDELVGVEAHLVLAHRPSEGIGIDHARHGLEILLDHPCLDRSSGSSRRMSGLVLRSV